MKTLEQYISEKEKINKGFIREVNRQYEKIEISYLLKHTREKRKISQLDLANKCHISQQAISKIENAKDDHISLHSLNKYANALGYRLKMKLEQV